MWVSLCAFFMASSLSFIPTCHPQVNKASPPTTSASSRFSSLSQFACISFSPFFIASVGVPLISSYIAVFESIHAFALQVCVLFFWTSIDFVFLIPHALFALWFYLGKINTFSLEYILHVPPFWQHRHENPQPVPLFHHTQYQNQPQSLKT